VAYFADISFRWEWGVCRLIATTAPTQQAALSILVAATYIRNTYQ
jgi:hypothetical protein